MTEMHKVAEVDELQPGKTKLVERGGGRVVLANVDGEICAFSDECTHDGGPLSEGELDGDVVTCPWHFSKFNVRSGEIVESPAEEEIPVYEVKVEGGSIYLGSQKDG